MEVLHLNLGLKSGFECKTITL